MSHFVKCKTKISNITNLKKAINHMGCQFHEATTYQSGYAGAINCIGTISAKDQAVGPNHGAAVIKKDKGYEIVMDNYHNSLREVAGSNCSRITQKYAELETTGAFVNSGYVRQSSRVDQKTGELVLKYTSL